MQGGIRIRSVDWDNSTGQIKVYIRNDADYRNLTLSQIQIYVNGTLDESVVITRLYNHAYDRLFSQTYDIALSGTYANCPSQVTVKVITDFGAFCEAYDDNLTG